MKSGESLLLPILQSYFVLPKGQNRRCVPFDKFISVMLCDSLMLYQYGEMMFFSYFWYHKLNFLNEEIFIGCVVADQR